VRWTGTGDVGGGTWPARVSYDSYGKARHHQPGDVDGDGKVDGSDQGDLMGVWDTVITERGYRGDADFNRDGEIDANDLGSLFGFWGAALPAGQISFTTAGRPDNSRSIHYTLCCNERVSIDFGGSYFPSHQVYVGAPQGAFALAIGMRRQDRSRLGQFFFTAGIVPPTTFASYEE